MSASLKSELARLSAVAAQSRGDGAEDVLLQCPSLWTREEKEA